MKLNSLSVFLPAYNEEKNIQKTIKNVFKHGHKVANDLEVIVVDDGSSDKTARKVKKLQKDYSKLRLVVHQKNRGYGGALKTGFKEAKKDWVAYIDSDGQFDFKAIKRFVKKTPDSDLVIGFRKKRSDSLYRRVLQKILRLVGLALFGINVKDVDCGFKLIKKSVIKKIGSLQTESAITETELVVRASRKGFKISQVGVEHLARSDGEQTGGRLLVVFKAAYEGIKLWWQLLNKPLAIGLVFILGLSAFLRFYQIRDYLVFLGDEGRDVLVVKRMIVDKDWTFLGPTASVGGFYLGPAYYYFMLPFLWAWQLDPVGPAIMVAIFGVLTVGLVYQVSKKITPLFGLIAAFLYAINPLVVHYSRSSWNPNLVPFFTLLIIWLMQKGLRKLDPRFWLGVGVCLGIAWQLHYITLIFLPIVFITTLTILPKKMWFKSALWAALGAVLGISPFLAFEIKNHFPNAKTIFEFLTRKDGAVGFSFKKYFLRVWQNGWRFFEESLFLKSWEACKVLFLSTVFIAVAWFKKFRLVSLWWLLGLLGISLYRGAIHDYYFGFLYPFGIILLTAVAYWFLKNRWWLKLFGLGLLVFLSYQSYQNLYLHTRPSKLVAQTQELSHLVLEKTQGEEFNFALVAGQNSDHAYRYFFEIWDRSPVPLEKKVTNQLLVLCEDPSCQPLGHPLWEIAAFGRAEITGEWTVGPEFKIFRLTHHSDSINLIGKPAKGGT